MFKIMGKKVDLERSEILYDTPFTQTSINEDFEAASGKWSVTDDGWLTGQIMTNGGGIIYSNANYEGDIIMDFLGRTVAPCKNDLNFTFRAAGWNFDNNDAGISYIAGLQGWWTGKTGIERYPEMELQAMTCLHNFIPGKVYHIQAGIIDKYCFIIIDGILAVELKDNNPIDSKKYGRIGFGSYCSTVQFKDFKLYSPYSENLYLSYPVN